MKSPQELYYELEQLMKEGASFDGLQDEILAAVKALMEQPYPIFFFLQLSKLMGENSGYAESTLRGLHNISPEWFDTIASAVRKVQKERAERVAAAAAAR
jgi:hypothetical protein